MKARIKELSKDVLLVLLSVNLVILTLAALSSESVRRSPLLSTLLQPLGFMLGLDQAELTYLEIREPVLDAAQPVTISVNTAAGRYSDFLRRHEGLHLLYLELGVGMNTPVIIKYPFWRMTYENPRATYACVNYGEAYAPREIARRSICIDGDIDAVLDRLKSE